VSVFVLALVSWPGPNNLRMRNASNRCLKFFPSALIMLITQTAGA